MKVNINSKLFPNICTLLKEGVAKVILFDAKNDMIQYWSKLSHCCMSINLEEIGIANSFTNHHGRYFSTSFPFFFFNKQGNTLKELIKPLWLLLYLYEYECPIFRHSFRFLFRICFHMNLILSFCNLLLSRPYFRAVRCWFCLYSLMAHSYLSVQKRSFSGL